MPSVAIVGGGAIGLAYASHLCRVADVLVIDRNPQTARAAADGRLCVTLRTEDGVRPLGTSFEVREGWAPFDADWILICVKTGSTATVADRLAETWGEQNGLVVSVQNGLGNREKLATALPTERIRAGICHVAAKRLQPGVVEVGRTEVTVIERRGEDTQLLKFRDLLTSAGLAVRLEPDIDRLIWNKLIIAVGCNALAALGRLPLGAFGDLGRGALGGLVTDAMSECASVMRRKGIALDGDPVSRLEQIARASPGNYPSMLQDILRRQDTEIGALNGAVVREAAEVGVATPVNDMLVRLIRVAEESAAERVASWFDR